MRMFVFLGPTLAAAEAARLLPARYLPPIQRGDILRLLESRPDAIGIVDGYFDSVRSVWHKEILVALRRGVHVFGAASMGALRAAELAPFGMVGVGEVFRWYRDGIVDADDEVAVVHGPAESGFRRMSDALVDIRDACRAAREAGVISAELARTLVSRSAELHYPTRSLRLLPGFAAEEGQDPAALRDFLDGYGSGLKERDARALLTHMAEVRDRRPGPLEVDYHVERTVFLERLEHEIELTSSAGTSRPPAEEDVLRTGETVAVLRKKVLLRLLARQEAERLGLRAGDDEVQLAVDDFRRRCGLLTLADTQAWAAAEGVTSDDLVEVITDGVLIDKLEQLYGHRIDGGLPRQVRMSTARGWRES
ncbi:TfuA-like protein [Actinoplanes aureus]|uniref:TfuA-like core domain-containing protein n=1 Tax=Actinoplanes aureus TaxID=2792083 RepID=A0A931CJE3_9ACTN|nr:TfuA-like protein [Actinoplanes aureus]MBG0566020.1 hypothetical protein [Actinoplanes aureus]